LLDRLPPIRRLGDYLKLGLVFQQKP